MNILDYLDMDELMEIDDAVKKNETTIVSELSKTHSEYEAKRLAEIIIDKPDVLEPFGVSDNNVTNELLFVFSDEDFEYIQKLFKVLVYQRNNCNQNWLLTELVRLFEEEKIDVNFKNKTITVKNNDN